MHKLRSSPTSKDSPTHDLTAPCFGSGACKECLTFVKNFEKVSTGQNLTSGTNEFALARRLPQGEALTSLENAIKGKDETTENRKAGFEAIAKVVFPPKAALTQNGT